MNTKLYSVENTSFLVSMENSLTSIDRQVLNTLYLPIIDNNALDCYNALASLVNTNSFESDILLHNNFLTKFHFDPKLFVESRIKLEAVGLLKVYFKDNVYLYELLLPLSAKEFFNNEELSTIFNYNVENIEATKIYKNLMNRKLDSKKFSNITKSFDEVFELSDEFNHSIDSITPKNNGIVIKNEDFDMQQFLLLIEVSGLVNSSVLKDYEFIDAVTRYSFLFNLNVEEMKNATLLSLKGNDCDINQLKLQAKHIFDEKKLHVTFKPIKHITTSNDKAINLYNTLSPTKLVESVFKTALTSSEILMIDELLIETELPLGVINVCLFYVLKNKDGEIPSKNYFLKILNTWKRSGVTTTLKALEYINNKNKNNSKKEFIPKTKKTKELPEWYNEYKENNNKSLNDNESSELSEDITSFFKPSK